MLIQQSKEVEPLVSDKVGFVASKIEFLAYQTSFDIDKRQDKVPINISFFPEEKFKEAIKAMRGAFQSGICVSDLVAVAHQGEGMGGVIVPQGKVGLATVCSIIINGALLKAGVPTDSKFSGILQIKSGKPLRFVELIHYSGSSLDPSEIFITSKMTSVGRVATEGEGKMLANFREIPALCHPMAEKVIAGLKEAGAGSAPKITKVGGAEHETEPKKTQPIIQGQGSPGSAQRRGHNSRTGQPV